MKDVFARFSDDVNGEQSFTTSTCFDSTIDLRIHGRRWETYVCRQRVRNASLAIYVLRHTSSPALAPAAHPSPRVSATLPATPQGPPVPYVRSFLSSSTTQAARRGAPCHPRIDGPTRDRFAVPSAPVAATTGRGRRRTIRRQSIVIQFRAWQILSSGTHRLVARVDFIKSVLSTLELSAYPFI